MSGSLACQREREILMVIKNICHKTTRRMQDGVDGRKVEAVGRLAVGRKVWVWVCRRVRVCRSVRGQVVGTGRVGSWWSECAEVRRRASGSKDYAQDQYLA